MDKNKIVEAILAEWAMRSPDGLVGGYDTAENVHILNEIMGEYGINELDIGAGDFGVSLGDITPKSGIEAAELKKLKTPQSKFQRKDKKTGKIIVVGHPNYEDGTLLDDIKAGTAKVYTPAEKAKLELSPEVRAERIQNDIWEDMEAANGKNVGLDYVNQLISNFKKLKVSATLKNKFFNLYNNCSLKQALDIYNGNPSDLQVFIDAINDVRHQGLGKGELAFVYMLKNVKSGGIGDVDLLNVEGYGAVEVKEVGKGKEKVRISSSTLKGFARSDFKNAIEDMVSEIRRDEEFGKFLLEVLVGKNPDGTYIYPHPRTPTEEEVAALEKFIKDPKTADMGKNLFRSFVIVSAKLQINASGGKSTAKSKMSLDVDGSKKEFAITDADQARQQIQKISTNPDEKQTITLSVAPTVGIEDKSYLQIAKGLKFFDKNYNLKSISDEITKLVIGKYKGMLIVSGGKADTESGEKSSGPNRAKVVETKDIELEFDSIAQNGLVCAVKSDMSKLSGMGTL